MCLFTAAHLISKGDNFNVKITASRNKCYVINVLTNSSANLIW